MDRCQAKPGGSMWRRTFALAVNDSVVDHASMHRCLDIPGRIYKNSTPLDAVWVGVECRKDAKSVGDYHPHIRLLQKQGIKDTILINV